MAEEASCYQCPKCGCRSCGQDQFPAAGGDLARVFNVQNRKYDTVSFACCGYTGLYKALNRSAGLDVRLYHALIQAPGKGRKP